MGVSKQLSNLVNHLYDLIQNPSPDLQQNKKVVNNPSENSYYNPHKKKKVSSS